MKLNEEDILMLSTDKQFYLDLKIKVLLQLLYVDSEQAFTSIGKIMQTKGIHQATSIMTTDPGYFGSLKYLDSDGEQDRQIFNLMIFELIGSLENHQQQAVRIKALQKLENIQNKPSQSFERD